jgi:hypothetical protein
MSRADTSRASNEPDDRAPKPSDEHQADYERRLRAAGINEDECPENMDAFRYRLARMLCMFHNAWHGCPEKLCRRQRGCMAPDGFCANVKRPSPEERARDWPKLQLEVRTALDKVLAKRAAEVEACEEEELQRVLAKRRQGKAG